MSVEDFKGFGKAVAESEEYRAKAKEIGIDNIDGLIGFGKEIGYEFNMDDIQAYAEEIGSPTEELSDADLEKVAGGVFLSAIVALVSQTFPVAVSPLNEVAPGPGPGSW